MWCGVRVKFNENTLKSTDLGRECMSYAQSSGVNLQLRPQRALRNIMYEHGTTPEGQR
jgi:hypothetical protein